MSAFLSVRALWEEGTAKKEIARRLGLDVRTVRKYVKRLEAGAKEPRRAPVGRKLDPWSEQIEEKVRQGLTAVQIYQDLSGLKGFDACYHTVQRRVRELRPAELEVFCRMRYGPGEEAQIDFGEIGRIPVDGRSRRIYLFVMTLCYSRLAYYELVTNQQVPSFLGAIRHGFEYFGGAPERLKPDNLKAAVLIDRLGQRYYQEDFFRLCRHYGTVPDAARPATPTDKGRTERDIGYAKGNCFRGRTFESLDAARAHLIQWRENVANVRLHGTTRRRPVDLFAEERDRLTSLPEDPFEVCDWGLYKVRKDCHIHVAGNYYSVPHAFVGQRVLVRLGADELAIFTDGEPLCRHRRATGAGQDVTDPAHYPPTKRISNHEIHRRRVEAVRSAGPHSAEFLHRLRHGHWVYGDQLGRMARLLEDFGTVALEGACERALYFGATDGIRPLERILEAGLYAIPLPSSANGSSHDQASDFGRPLHEYDALLDEEVAA